METDVVLVTEVCERIEGHARQLIRRTLAPLESEIEIVAVKIDHDVTHPTAIFDYRCNILLKTKDGATIRAHARDCDDILAVYQALTKLVDRLSMRKLEDSCNMPEKIEKPLAY